ncbi:hypothetical protein Cgig2_021063 [Carnegiea gigantea]|uniref:ATP-sulfurylase PUA-like domain-containing protein n=1 Tax=Carnegiea gigantea TaxID=171969 RepID=A0A9Q1GVK6_9CARY|nr:hypothetical protein Cgig2_021063 [Carnegiea gigantea]
MASMAALLPKTPNPTISFPKTTKTQFVPSFNLSIRTANSGATRRRPIRVRSALIEPDGGKLVELVVDEPLRREKKRAALNLPRIKLSRIDLQWVHVLSEGWASPLRGFMRENEFLQTLHFNSLRLADGSVVNMSVPIVLAIDHSVKSQIGESDRVALFDSATDVPVAILSEMRSGPAFDVGPSSEDLDFEFWGCESSMTLQFWAKIP